MKKILILLLFPVNFSLGVNIPDLTNSGIQIIKASISIGNLVKETISPSEQTQLKTEEIDSKIKALKAEEELNQCLIQNSTVDQKVIFTCNCKKERDELVRHGGYEILNRKKREFSRAIKEIEKFDSKKTNIVKDEEPILTKNEIIFFTSCAAVIGVSVIGIVNPPLAIAVAKGITIAATKVGATAKTAIVGATISEKVLATGTLITYTNCSISAGKIVRPLVYETKEEELQSLTEAKSQRPPLVDRIRTERNQETK